MRNEIIRERSGFKEDVVTNVEKSMFRWFGHVERMNERRLTKGIYMADVSGNAGRDTLERPTLTLLVRFFRKVRCAVLVTGVLV